jgi:hypothetical protein
VAFSEYMNFKRASIKAYLLLQGLMPNIVEKLANDLNLGELPF